MLKPESEAAPELCECAGHANACVLSKNDLREEADSRLSRCSRDEALLHLWMPSVRHTFFTVVALSPSCLLASPQPEVHELLEVALCQEHSLRAPPQLSLPRLSARMDQSSANRALHSDRALHAPSLFL